MPLLSKPSGKSNVRYFNPAYGQDVYLVTIEEATLSVKDKSINVYGKCSIKNVLSEPALIAWNINSEPYKGKSYSEGELVEVEITPDLAEVSLFTELRNLLGDKERISIKGTISIGIQGSQVELEVSEAKATSKGNFNKGYSPESFYENTKAVLEARKDFYIAELNKFVKGISLTTELKELTDIGLLNAELQGDKEKALAVANYSTLIKSFWNGDK